MKKRQAKLHSLLNSGLAYHKNGELLEASRIYQMLLAQHPMPDAYHLLGVVQYQQSSFLDAEKNIRQAIDIKPLVADYYSNLGLVLHAQGLYKDAVEQFDFALSIEPRHVQSLYNKGMTLCAIHKYSESEKTLLAAISCQPSHAKAYNNLGNVYKAQMRLDEAQVAFERAIALNPDLYEAYWNLSFIAFLQRDLMTAWSLFDYRWYQAGYSKPRNFKYTLWRGEPLKNKTLLVWGEQGIGDEIMFASCLNDVIEFGATIVVECDDRLVSLYENSFKGIQCISRSEHNRHLIESLNIDYQISIGSLCAKVRPHVEDFRRVPYLKAIATPSKSILPPKQAQLRVGFSWKSGNKETGQTRSVPLNYWSGLFGNSDLEFVNLQYGECEHEIRQIEAAHNIKVLRPLANPLVELESFFSAIKACDLVISVDNSTVHMAGSMGVATWTVLPASPDWRWLAMGDKALWYPNMTLFRQTLGESKDTLMNRVYLKLKELRAVESR